MDDLAKFFFGRETSLITWLINMRHFALKAEAYMGDHTSTEISNLAQNLQCLDQNKRVKAGMERIAGAIPT